MRYSQHLSKSFCWNKVRQHVTWADTWLVGRISRAGEPRSTIAISCHSIHHHLFVKLVSNSQKLALLVTGPFTGPIDGVYNANDLKRLEPKVSGHLQFWTLMLTYWPLMLISVTLLGEVQSASSQRLPRQSLNATLARPFSDASPARPGSR